MTNVKNSYRAGVELMSAWKIDNMLELQGNLTLMQSRIKDFTESALAYDSDWNETTQTKKLGDRAISYSPNLVAFGQVKFTPVENYDFYLTYKHVGKQYFDNTENDARSLSGYGTLNARFDMMPEIAGRRNITLQFLANNLFGTQYSANAYGGNWYEQGVEKTWAYYYPSAGMTFV